MRARVAPAASARSPPAPRAFSAGSAAGSKKGKCEIGPEKDCGWELIYNRLKALDRLDKLRLVPKPKEWGKMTADLSILGTDHFALEYPAKEEVKAK